MSSWKRRVISPHRATAAEVTRNGAALASGADENEGMVIIGEATWWESDNVRVIDMSGWHFTRHMQRAYARQATCALMLSAFNIWAACLYIISIASSFAGERHWNNNRRASARLTWHRLLLLFEKYLCEIIFWLWQAISSCLRYRRSIGESICNCV